MTELADEQGNGLRDTIESAYATSTASPDLDSIVSGAVEQRDRGLRDKGNGLDRFAAEAKASDSIRDAARKAITETKQRAASGPAEAVQGLAIDPGAPKDWDADARSEWASLPQSARLAIQRAEAARQEAYAPYAEMEAVIAPAREAYRQAGITKDADAVKQLFSWEASLRNPETRMQAFHSLAQTYQIDLAGMGGGSAPQYTPEAHTLEQFASSGGREHFAEVSHAMGYLLSRKDGGRYVTGNGTVDLARLYDDALRHEGISTAPKPALASTARAPASNQRGNRSSVRDTILASVRQVRGAA